MRVLLYSPLFFGHPVVYCRVIARILVDLGCEVIIAAPGLRDFAFSGWGELAGAMGSAVRTSDLGGERSPAPWRTTAEELVALQRQHGADSTLFIYADHFREEFIRLAEGRAPRLLGNTVGIFSLTAAWCPGEDSLTGQKLSWRGPTLRRTLGNLQRAVTQRRQTDAYFYRHVLLKRRVVSTLLVKDERVLESFGPPVYWMPEIYKVFGEEPDAAAITQWQRIAQDYQRFLAAHPGKEVLLYFGNAAWYKGYDTFLRLASSDPSVLCVHCGAPDVADGKFEVDVHELRARLQSEGRLFETGEFLQAHGLIEEFFRSARRLVSTHRASGTSGTVLQAVELGLPVLTPDLGLLGHRTRRHGVGRTYRYGDFDDLCKQWERFKLAPPESFASNTRAFMQLFSREALKECLSQVLLGR